MINDIKAPLQQLLQMATKAERSIKAAKEQLKRQKLKAAVAEVKKAAKEDVKETVAIFDQGVAAASQISRITFAEAAGKLKDFDLSAPVVIEAKDILSDALKSVQSQLNSRLALTLAGRESLGFGHPSQSRMMMPLRPGTSLPRSWSCSRSLVAWLGLTSLGPA